MATVSSGERGKRIATLDIVRGIAVMGILAMNIVAFAMPEQAYFNPLAYGSQRAIDFASYAFTFVFVEGKMRGLFSFLFGASMLLVIQLARPRASRAAKVTFARQFWLLIFGMIHFYLIWWGDILIGYALIGMVAWFFRNKAPKSLMRWGIGLIVFQFLFLGAMAVMTFMLSAAVAAPNPDPKLVEAWKSVTEMIAVPTQAIINADLAVYRGAWAGIVEHHLTEPHVDALHLHRRDGLGDARLHAARHGGPEERLPHRRVGRPPLPQGGDDLPGDRSARLRGARGLAARHQFRRDDLVGGQCGDGAVPAADGVRLCGADHPR